jgi:hypothetical protein
MEKDIHRNEITCTVNSFETFVTCYAKHMPVNNKSEEIEINKFENAIPIGENRFRIKLKAGDKIKIGKSKHDTLEISVYGGYQEHIKRIKHDNIQNSKDKKKGVVILSKEQFIFKDVIETWFSKKP